MSYTNNNVFSIKPAFWIAYPWILATIFIPFLLPICIYKLIEVYCWRFDFNDMTMSERKGVFSVERREVSYARIKSIKIEEPFLYRLVDISRVVIQSSEPFMKDVVLNGIYAKDIVKEFLDEKIAEARKREGIREFDMYNL